jgi:hypothetical protein
VFRLNGVQGWDTYYGSGVVVMGLLKFGTIDLRIYGAGGECECGMTGETAICGYGAWLMYLRLVRLAFSLRSILKACKDVNTYRETVSTKERGTMKL